MKRQRKSFFIRDANDQRIELDEKLADGSTQIPVADSQVRLLIREALDDAGEFYDQDIIWSILKDESKIARDSTTIEEYIDELGRDISYKGYLPNYRRIEQYLFDLLHGQQESWDLTDLKNMFPIDAERKEKRKAKRNQPLEQPVGHLARTVRTARKGPVPVFQLILRMLIRDAIANVGKGYNPALHQMVMENEEFLAYTSYDFDEYLVLMQNLLEILTPNYFDVYNVVIEFVPGQKVHMLTDIVKLCI